LADLDAGLLSDGDAGSDAFDDEFAFVSGEGGEHVQPQPPRRGGWVDPVRDGPDLYPAVANSRDRVEDVQEGAAEEVDAPYDEGVSLGG
jgi:hypothetical protein